jgi:hypothetical protein
LLLPPEYSTEGDVLAECATCLGASVEQADSDKIIANGEKRSNIIFL